MQPHDHACYYCRTLVEAACECSRPARAVICENCRIVYEPLSEDDGAEPNQ
jgi:hypothetical protein